MYPELLEMTYYNGYPDLAYAQQRDRSKQHICTINGFTLIVIPFWWDQQTRSLMQTIQNARPDLMMPSGGDAIPTEMPLYLQRDTGM